MCSCISFIHTRVLVSLYDYIVVRDSILHTLTLVNSSHPAGEIDGEGVLSVMGTPEPLYLVDRDGATHGGDICAPHDVYLPPVCADGAGTPLVGAPEWCLSPYCYVDPANCAVANSLSKFFPLTKLYYSYATCGATNTFDDYATCGCQDNEFHTKGMPPSLDDPPLQPDGGIGGPAREWKCEACPEGVFCTGRTAAALRVRAGWFVVRHVSSKTGAEKRPDLLQCKSSVACKGGIVILPELAPMSPGAPDVASTCDVVAGRNSSGGPQCQCSTGRTGMLCGACQSDTPRGLDWVNSGSECKECSTSRANATAIVVIVFVLVLVFFISLRILFRRLMRLPRIEKRFVQAFSNLEKKGAAVVVDAFFGPGSRFGITREVFIAQCSAHLRKGTAPAKIERDVKRLWVKLDADGDGQVNLIEFIQFLYGIKRGKHTPNKLLAIKRWYYSLKMVSSCTPFIVPATHESTPMYCL